MTTEQMWAAGAGIVALVVGWIARGFSAGREWGALRSEVAHLTAELAATRVELVQIRGDFSKLARDLNQMIGRCSP